MCPVFAGAKYRFGSAKTSLCFEELYDGRIPIGGITKYFANHRSGTEVSVLLLSFTFCVFVCVNNGLHAQYARFMGMSNTRIFAEELYALGLVTHVMPEDPAAMFGEALGKTMPGFNTAKKSEGEKEELHRMKD